MKALRGLGESLSEEYFCLIQLLHAVSRCVANYNIGVPDTETVIRPLADRVALRDRSNSKWEMTVKRLSSQGRRMLISMPNHNHERRFRLPSLLRTAQCLALIRQIFRVLLPEVGGPQEQDSTLTELTFLVLQGSQADLRFPISTKALVAIRQAGLRFPFLCVGGSWGLPSSALKISSDAAVLHKHPIAHSDISDKNRVIGRTSRSILHSVGARHQPKLRLCLTFAVLILRHLVVFQAVPEANSMYAYPSKAGESAISPKWSLSLHIEDVRFAIRVESLGGRMFHTCRIKSYFFPLGLDV
ncbi:hypothetical protein CCUS01_00486 [Colletotrichum cuscutae]|uniref:Uncharacterized protein n=1 Tax=Colletotrichum cuscutae TaxID=1209917 RepID=A0AAI9VAF0_9PEZI|nr:hypothetical protein CCUS01_00486 [Colletotrichum cuscutae]